MPNEHDSQDLVNTIQAFCRAFDLKDWAVLRRCLAEDLFTDYSSFRGTPPARMTADEFIALRQRSLEGLVTEHTSLNHIVTFTEQHASCRFDFVIRRWPRDASDTRFFHTSGYYDVVLCRRPEAPYGWVLESIRQHALRNEGNPDLHIAYRPAPAPSRPI